MDKMKISRLNKQIKISLLSDAEQQRKHSPGTTSDHSEQLYQHSCIFFLLLFNTFKREQMVGRLTPIYMTRDPL